MTPEERILIALDIDGTLLTWGGHLHKHAERAVHRVIADPRLELVLATGRSAHSAMGVARRIGLDQGWAVCSNGSVTVRLDPAAANGWEIAHSVTFDAAPAVAAIRLAFPKARLAVEDAGHGFLVTRQFPDGELDGIVTVVDDTQLAARPVTRVIVRETDLDPARVEALVDELQLPDVSYAVGWTGWVDLNPPGVSKASALEALRRRLGVAQGRTVAIGDGGNDITMLRWAARGVAMGGARPEVKAAADEVTGTINLGGLARVLNSLV
ncbi:MAG: Cof-type HAD-IIB family hydrolase [Bifidobacteriaceae bacterium]|jgi:HAD superfamily hydrolase (TIGR01484 family)|nr:Cof-type HAD-IIB family hydrolase [Bifidobacteriaceae bacterium]